MKFGVLKVMDIITSFILIIILFGKGFNYGGAKFWCLC
jgi:hypothetical protein